jgi:hypothetical protein
MAGLHHRKAATRALIHALTSLLLLLFALRSTADSSTATASRSSSSRPAARVAAMLQVICGRDAAWLVGALITTVETAVIGIP